MSTRPATPFLGVPPLPAVRIDDDRLGGDRGRQIHRAVRVAWTAAVHPDRDHLVAPFGQGEGRRQLLPCPGTLAGDRVREPDRQPVQVHHPQQGLRLVHVRHRLQREHIGARRDESLDPGPVETLQLPHGQPVLPPVLAAVRQHRPVRPDRRRDPHLVRNQLASSAGQFNTAGEQPRGLLPCDSTPLEALEGGLVAGGDQHLRARPHIGRVRRLDLAGIVGEQPRRPELVGQIASLCLQLVGEAPVEDDDTFGQGGGKGAGGAHRDQLSWDWTWAEISSKCSRSSRSRTWR